jgi:predicted branched-subunit amino acid permease
LPRSDPDEPLQAPEPVNTPPGPTSGSAFLTGFAAAWRSIFAYVLFGTYIGIGALAHDFGFSPGWMLVSTLLVWAAPAQVILISTLSTASLIEVAVAIGLSSVRFLPMVVSLLPMLKDAGTPQRRLVIPAHLTAISVWVESMRLVPPLPRSRRIGFFNGLGSGFLTAAVVGSLIGFYLAAKLPPLFAGALLFFTPLSLLMSLSRNSRVLAERVAFILGLIIGPLLAGRVSLDLMWTGVIAGTLAFIVHRVREAWQ